MSMSASPRKLHSAEENAAPNQAVAEEPQVAPPKQPRTAFICFTDAKKNSILSAGGNDKDLLHTVAAEWKLMSDRDRGYWEEEAREDKLRFVREKAEYKGPWNIPKRRAKKNPNAPKRPMSAFLKYSQRRRKAMKTSNPELSNTDVSRLLGEMWRNSSKSEQAPYVEQEEVERAKYKEETKKFKEEQAQLDAASRISHHSVQTAMEKQTPKYRRDYDRSPFMVDGPVDRRIFRSYSGSGHPVENKPYKVVHHRSYHPSYQSTEVARAHPPDGDSPRFQPHKFVDARSYKSVPVDSASAGGPGIIQPHHARHHPAVYRATYPPPQQAENHHLGSLKNTGSDISQFDAFSESEPPFNPRQTRPSSSHYFPDSFYQYP